MSTESVRVCVRVRPLSNSEQARQDQTCIDCPSDESVVIADREYGFEYCETGMSDQESFFQQSGVVDLLESAVQGYSATMFAYGQTGSGKTFTMSGPEEAILQEGYSGSRFDGVVPRAFRFLVDNVKGRGRIRACTYEVYNEQIYDLLNPDAGPLQVRESNNSGFFIENLLVVDCESTADMMEVFAEGVRNRTVGSHELNKDSSRSHGVVTIFVDIDSGAQDSIGPLRGKISFVDLAGSERLKESKSQGGMRRETGAINKSLFTLSKVISALDRRDTFVPYRDSKLTKLLMDSLGGNSKCLMVACCSPSEKYLDESVSTLTYASRARNIQNKPVIQMDQTSRLIAELKTEIVELKSQVQKLTAENQSLRSGQSFPQGGVPSHSRGNPSLAVDVSYDSTSLQSSSPYHVSSQGVAMGGGMGAGMFAPEDVFRRSSSLGGGIGSPMQIMSQSIGSASGGFIDPDHTRHALKEYQEDHKRLHLKCDGLRKERDYLEAQLESTRAELQKHKAMSAYGQPSTGGASARSAGLTASPAAYASTPSGSRKDANGGGYSARKSAMTSSSSSGNSMARLPVQDKAMQAENAKLRERIRQLEAVSPARSFASGVQKDQDALIKLTRENAQLQQQVERLKSQMRQAETRAPAPRRR